MRNYGSIAIVMVALLPILYVSVSANTTSNGRRIETRQQQQTSVFDRKTSTNFNTLYLFLNQVNICYARFKRCSSLLHPAVCSSTNVNFSFFIWVKKMAKQIMQSSEVNCPRNLLEQFYQLDSVLKHKANSK